MKHVYGSLWSGQALPIKRLILGDLIIIFIFFSLFTFTRHALVFVAWKAIQWERRVLR